MSPPDQPRQESIGESGSFDDEPFPEPTPGRSDVRRAQTISTTLKDTRVWGLLGVRAYLALVFFEAAIGHLAVYPQVLASQWTPTGAFHPIGVALRSNPVLFIHLVIALELALAASVTVGLFTRWAGLGGLVLNAFFFAAFEWGDVGQLYLSWDASLAALWFVVLVTGPGQYIGLAQILGPRFPRLKPWIS